MATMAISKFLEHFNNQHTSPLNQEVPICPRFLEGINSHTLNHCVSIPRIRISFCQFQKKTLKRT